MSRRRRHSKAYQPPVVPDVNVRGMSDACTHGLMLYPSAAAARNGARAIRAGDATRRPDPTAKLRPFRCADLDDLWHLGPLPPAVVAGVVDAATYYAGKAPASCYAKERHA